MIEAYRLLVAIGFTEMSPYSPWCWQQRAGGSPKLQACQNDHQPNPSAFVKSRQSNRRVFIDVSVSSRARSCSATTQRS